MCCSCQKWAFFLFFESITDVNATDWIWYSWVIDKHSFILKVACFARMWIRMWISLWWHLMTVSGGWSVVKSKPKRLSKFLEHPSTLLRLHWRKLAGEPGRCLWFHKVAQTVKSLEECRRENGAASRCTLQPGCHKPEQHCRVSNPERNTTFCNWFTHSYTNDMAFILFLTTKYDLKTVASFDWFLRDKHGAYVSVGMNAGFILAHKCWGSTVSLDRLSQSGRWDFPALQTQL